MHGPIVIVCLNNQRDQRFFYPMKCKASLLNLLIKCHLIPPPPCSGFSPLTGFMNKEDYESVVTDLRLKVQKQNKDLGI